MNIKDQINECLELYHKIEEEHPEELNLDQLHEVTGKYAKIKEYRDKINRYPKEIRTFCEYILATKDTEEERLKFLSFISSNPRAFSTDKKETFIEKRQRISNIAKEIGIADSIIFRLLSIAKLKGLLGKQDELVDEYCYLIKQYLSTNGF